MKKFQIIIICLFVCISLHAQKKHYVKPNGFASLNSSSWNWASRDLQGVIDIASPGDTVYVAVGVYSGGFVMREGVSVKGGYTANPENPEERVNPLLQTDDPEEQSVLDGNGTQRVLTQYFPFSQRTVWEGFVIQNGKPSDNPEVGNLIYAVDGTSTIAGVLYKYDPEEKQGMMVSREEVKKQWGGYRENLPELPIVADSEEASSDWSDPGIIIENLQEKSVDFTETDIQYNGNYAAFWCDTLISCGYSDWYLPSSGELREIFEAGINTQLKDLDKELNSVYWSASQAGDVLAWTYSFHKDHFHPSLKYVKHTVTAVHALDLSGSEPSLQSAGGGAFLQKKGILRNCFVTGNESPFRGGGVYVGGGGELQDCIVAGNEAPEGPQVYYEWPVGIDEMPEIQTFRIYPSLSRVGDPVILEIYSPFTEANYQLFDLSGKRIMGESIKTTKTLLPLFALKGTYIFTIQIDNKNYNQKIIRY